LEGEVLPPFANIESHHERIIYSVDARNNPQFNPIARSTAMMLVNQHKLVYYKGYEHTPGGEPFFELYDLQNDPEELENLYSENFRYAVELKKELLEKMNQQDEPYSN
jgi:tryptophanyl-tRNA synthetase